jgi:hypothetical protein
MTQFSQGHVISGKSGQSASFAEKAVPFFQSIPDRIGQRNKNISG